MNSRRLMLPLLFLSVFSWFSVSSVAQTSDTKNFRSGGVSFDYPNGWVLEDDSNSDAQQLTLTRANNDVQIRVFVHRGRITPEKLPEAKKAFIDPYIAATVKQFVAMGGKPEQSPDSTEIAGAQAEGVKIAANFGEPGAAKIYWAVVGQRTVILTIFGPDRESKQFTSDWEIVRNSLKVADVKAGVSASPKPSP